jgi:outer membrane receptor protein involved in Fe transport
LFHNFSSLKTIDEDGQSVSGNEIPYLPNFNGQLILDWFFMEKNKLRVSGDYVGKRFNEVSNSNQLDSYFLLNAKVDVNLTDFFTIYVYGNNLLDKKYDVYYTYVAPGMNVGAGIRLKY